MNITSFSTSPYDQTTKDLPLHKQLVAQKKALESCSSEEERNKVTKRIEEIRKRIRLSRQSLSPEITSQRTPQPLPLSKKVTYNEGSNKTYFIPPLRNLSPEEHSNAYYTIEGRPENKLLNKNLQLISLDAIEDILESGLLDPKKIKKFEAIRARLLEK